VLLKREAAARIAKKVMRTVENCILMVLGMETSLVLVMMVLEDGNKLMGGFRKTRSLLYTQNTLRKEGIRLDHIERGGDSQQLALAVVICLEVFGIER
jgi:hypothetical protein